MHAWVQSVPVFYMGRLNALRAVLSLWGIVLDGLIRSWPGISGLEIPARVVRFPQWTRATWPSPRWRDSGQSIPVVWKVLRNQSMDNDHLEVTWTYFGHVPDVEPLLLLAGSPRYSS